MTKILSSFLDNSGSDLKFDQFCSKLETFMNQEDPGLKKFVFDVFNTLSIEKDKLTEESLFKFMSLVS